MHEQVHAPLLEVSGLRVFGLSPVAFSLAAGECITLQGPSGTGKTLLLRALADLDQVEGSVRLNGVERTDMTGPDWRGAVRYFAAEPGWWSDRIGEHFASKRDGTALLHAFGLPAEAMDWEVARTSTGERQRLGLARGLLDEPKVLLLDEPSSALDREATRLVESIIRQRLAERGAGAIVVTHDDAQARRLAKRRLTIRDGAVVQEPA